MDKKKIKILLVDDDDNIRGTYAEIFKREGFEVSEAVDGMDGLEKAGKIIPDVIFTGIIMPKMDGFMLMESLAKNVATSKIPIFISSHMGREEDRKRALELGAKDFIFQGMITPKQVVEKIEAVFESRDYKINFLPGELDAQKLAEDFHFNSKFSCSNCYSQMVLNLKINDVSRHEFIANFVCPKCGKISESQE